MGDQPQLDWNTAQVSHGTLSVQVTGEVEADWEQTFARTLALLSSSGTWGSVGFAEGKVTVADVPEGEEENLRFSLDGAVQEANAHHHEDEADESDEKPDEDGDGSEGDDADRRMTDRFRDPSD